MKSVTDAEATDMNTPVTPENAAVPDKLAQLLAKAGPRPAPPATLEIEVRAAVHAEWRHLIQSRKSRRQRRWLAAAAMLLGAFGMSWLALNMNSQTAMIATITQLQGGSTLNEAAAGSQSQIHDGDVLRTGSDGGLGIALSTGIRLRLASASELRWLNANEVQLVRGAAYIDSHGSTAALTVHTAQGDVTHLGTRYLVDAGEQTLRVAVREGRVTLHAGPTQLTVNAQEQLQMDAQAQIVRSVLRMDDPAWQWVDALAQPFTLENRSVAEFLQWVASETGYEVNYASGSVATAARSAVLHGRQTSLPPLQALQMVLATTDFHAALQGKQLLISQQQ